MWHLVLGPHGAFLVNLADTSAVLPSDAACLAADFEAELEYSALHVTEKLCATEMQGSGNGIIVVANSISQTSARWL